jgi:phage shock protein PspC (stress-responsive transcriptional regulator)
MSEYITPTSEIKRLERPVQGRMLAGVAAGLARYFDLSPAFFRLGFVVLTLLGGSGVLVYLAALLIVPEEGKAQSIAGEVLANRRDRPGPVVGLGLAGIALLVLVSRAAFWPAAGVGWVLILVAGLVILWTYRGSNGRARRLLRVLAALCILGLVTLLVALVSALAWFHVHPGAGIGDRFETPTSFVQLEPSYHLGVGKLVLDLSQLPPVTQEIDVKARVDVGNLRIVVPSRTAVTVRAHAQAGRVQVFGQEDSGRHAAVEAGRGLLVIDASVGAGKITVTRAGG